MAASTATLSGTVTSAAGGAAIGASVLVSLPVPSGGSVVLASTTTSSSGAYSFQVAPATYTVQASAGGFAGSTVSGLSVPAGGISQSFALRPGGTVVVSGTVVDATGAGVGGVFLAANCVLPSGQACDSESFNFNYFPSLSGTGSNGAYQLTGPSAKYEIWAPACPDGCSALLPYSATQSLNSTGVVFLDASASGAFTAPNVVVAPASVAVGGSVTSAASGAAVSYPSVQAGFPSAISPGSLDPVAFADSDAAGHYSVQITPGSYSVQVDACCGFPPAQLFSLSASGTAVTDNLALAPFQVTISGHVLNGSAPVSGVSLDFNFAPAGAARLNGYLLSGPDATGVYRLTGPPGMYELWASSQTAGGLVLNSPALAVVDGSAGGSFSQDIQLAPAVTVGGAVTNGATGTPVAQAGVAFGFASSAHPGDVDLISSASTDAGGRYSVQLAPGSYSVSLSPPLNSGLSSATVSATISGATSSQDFALTPFPVTITGHVLNGNFLEPVGPAVVFESAGSSTPVASSSASLPFSIATDGAGGFTVTGPQGKYELFQPVSQCFDVFSGPCSPFFNSTSAVLVDATTGTSFSQDVQGAVASATLSGSVTDASTGSEIPSARITVSIPLPAVHHRAG